MNQEKHRRTYFKTVHINENRSFNYDTTSGRYTKGDWERNTSAVFVIEEYAPDRAPAYQTLLEIGVGAHIIENGCTITLKDPIINNLSEDAFNLACDFIRKEIVQL